MQNLKSVVNVHPKDQKKMKAEILTFHLAIGIRFIGYGSQSLEKSNFKRRKKFDGTSVFSSIQTSVRYWTKLIWSRYSTVLESLFFIISEIQKYLRYNGCSALITLKKTFANIWDSNVVIKVSNLSYILGIRPFSISIRSVKNG